MEPITVLHCSSMSNNTSSERAKPLPPTSAHTHAAGWWSWPK